MVGVGNHAEIVIEIILADILSASPHAGRMTKMWRSAAPSCHDLARQQVIWT